MPARVAPRPTSGTTDWLRIGLAMLGAQSRAERKVAEVSSWLVCVCRILGLSDEVVEALAGKLHILHSLLAPDFQERIAGRDPYRVFFKLFDYRKKSPPANP